MCAGRPMRSYCVTNTTGQSIAAGVQTSHTGSIGQAWDVAPNHQDSQRRLMTVRTFSPKAADVQRQWHVIDASDVVLGRLASQAAVLLRGKHKPIFAPHVDTGDFVIVVNASKVALSGNKLTDKRAYRHSGYPGGLRAVAYGDLMATNPERAVTKAVKGMLPKNTLGRQMLRKLKVYAGPEHPHQAQMPVPFEITQISQQANS
jgi:large subunit ribosomal protein L13